MDSAFSATLYLYKGAEIAMVTTVTTENQIRGLVGMFDKALLVADAQTWLQHHTVMRKPTCYEIVSPVSDDAGKTDASFYDPWHARSSGGRDVGAYMPSGYIKS